MAEIKIKCPTCGKILRLPETPTINTSAFTCPVCKDKHVVGKCQRFIEKPMSVQNSGEETQYSSTTTNCKGEETEYLGSKQIPGGEETQIHNSPLTSIGCLVDKFNHEYALCMGINTIGRKASSSSATVQIITQDRTMSRSHAIIEIRNAGGQMVHILRNGANKNPSYHNGVLIGSSDQMILNNGDTVKFGSTELTFKK